MNRVRLVDVAREAGVHPGTASRALNPNARGEVSRQTVRRVERAAHLLGYLPNTVARGLRTSRSLVVALVVPDITNPLFPYIVRGAEQVLVEAGYTLVLTDTNNDPGRERSQVAAMRAGGVDGFIVATARWQDPVLDELAAAAVPTVLVNRRNQSCSFPYFGTDDRHGIDLCVDHLKQLGHRSILHLAGPADTSTGRERASAFRQAMRARRLPTARAVVNCSSFTEQAGAAAVNTVLAQGFSFTAIVAGNDLLAIGALEALTARGIECPRDVSITGYNDVDFMRRLTPAFTTVRVPLNKMGALAARTLLGWLGGTEPELGAKVLLPVEFMHRGTTARAAR
ncbi:LacI family DNA-binding transcriptional regulator [Kutzneria buriramensis]|uniref:LacI family DNA-binding transcriptional regulator n=1 Tax=Kutzneria buriramensis TaxID=1045776 RepID=UPI000E277D2F|nr:LacI family DNA-binding transcriptional regulator [Kutzneria buriramensis]